MLTHPLLHHKIIVRAKSYSMTKFYLMVLAINELPKINSCKDTFSFPGFEEI